MRTSAVRSFTWVWLALTLPLLAPAIAPARAATSGIRDQAGFFSESAKTRAARTIAEIERSYRKEFVIETYREVPAEVRHGADLQDRAAVRRLFETWSVNRARELGVNGIYLVMTREPAHLQVAVGNETQRNGFTLADRNVLVDRMLESLRAKKNDEALLAGVGMVEETLRSHRAPAARAASAPSVRSAVPSVPQPARAPAGEERRGSGVSWFFMLLPIVVLGLVALLVVRILVGLFSRGRGMSGATPPFLGGGGGGGGGFLRSMLGGVFGAATGMWLYDRFTGHGGNAWGADVPPSPGGNDDIFSSHSRDTDYSSSGGDFGDSSSGGGDFGGGFGGGDSGGGGGGGGGDF